MISFIFRVNRSFLEYCNHPITVPTSKTRIINKRDIRRDRRKESRN